MSRSHWHRGHTAEAVLALRAANKRLLPYYRGIVWLENHAAGNVDYAARRIMALAPHGDDLQADLDLLKEAADSRADPEGWGLSSAYAGEALATALSLQAYDLSGMAADLTPYVAGAGNHLLASQLKPSDRYTGWRMGLAGESVDDSDVMVTAQVILALLSRTEAEFPLARRTAAVTALQEAVDAGLTFDLQKAHVALALLKSDPSDTGRALVLLDDLSTRMYDASSSAFTVSTTLRALAAALNWDDPVNRELVSFLDHNLHVAVNTGLSDKSLMSAISVGELKTLTTLDAADKGITDLTGLEGAVNLTHVNLIENEITDHAVLFGLESLQEAFFSDDSTKVLLRGEETSEPDSDADGLSDWFEEIYGTDPLAADTDADGLDDRVELALGTDPLADDSDGDGVLDGSDPNPVGVLGRCGLDVDGDGIFSPMTDGAVIIRFLQDPDGTSLPEISGLFGQNGTRTEETQVYAWLDRPGCALMLDVDDNGIMAADSDGLLIIRYLFGFSGTALVDGAIGENSYRNSSRDIGTWLNFHRKTPKQR